MQVTFSITGYEFNSVKTNVGASLLNNLLSEGSFPVLSITMRVGLSPYHLRVVRVGLSFNAVFVPTIIPID